MSTDLQQRAVRLDEAAREHSRAARRHRRRAREAREQLAALVAMCAERGIEVQINRQARTEGEPSGNRREDQA